MPPPPPRRRGSHGLAPEKILPRRLWVFPTTHRMMRTHLALEEARIPHELIPTPRGYGSSCGAAILLSREAEKKAVRVAGPGAEFRAFDYRPRPPAPLYGFLDGWPVSEELRAVLRKAIREEELDREEIHLLVHASAPAQKEAIRLVADGMRREWAGQEVQVLTPEDLAGLAAQGLKVLRWEKPDAQNERKPPGFCIVGNPDLAALARLILRACPIGMEWSRPEAAEEARRFLDSGGGCLVIPKDMTGRARNLLLAADRTGRFYPSLISK